MQLTRAADYAVRIMIHLAKLPPGSCSSGAELASVEEIPEHFAIKVLQILVRAGLLVSYRGTGGGFTLRTNPNEISVLSVVEAIEGRTALNACLTRPPSCDRRSRCAVHPIWIEAQEALTGVLRRASIASLAGKASTEVQWISPA
jgi:Rrf2 family protein